MENLLTTVEQSNQLKEFGIQKETAWYWVNMAHRSFDLDKYYLAYKTSENHFVVFGEKSHTPFHRTCGREEMSDCISAFTSQELWELMSNMLHNNIEQKPTKLLNCNVACSCPLSVIPLPSTTISIHIFLAVIVSFAT
jgi:hypothetical protein